MRTDPNDAQDLTNEIYPVSSMYTRDEVAKLFRCSPFTVKRWIAEGRLHATRPTLRMVRVSDVELQRFIRENT